LNYLDFLSALPAMLALLGFVIFTMLQGRILHDDISRDIVQKLRKQGTLDVDKYGQMTPAKLRATLDADRVLRAAVDQGDFELLKQTLRQQFLIRLVVYIILVALFVIGTGLYAYQVSRPRPLNISGIRIESGTSAAKGLAVDTDTLLVTCAADGPREDVKVSLENPRTHQRTASVDVSSSDGKVSFPIAAYHHLLTDRKIGAANPLRAVIQSQDHSFVSAETDVRVGITIFLAAQDKSITVAALIDNRLIQDYDFELQIRLPRHRAGAESIAIRKKVVGGKAYAQIDDPKAIDWTGIQVIYLGPDDPRIVRTEIVVDDRLKSLRREPATGHK
jgi:hypothetical protein